MAPVNITQEQISTLVEFMERHGDLSNNAKEIRSKFLWVELISILDQIGIGPRKSLDRWKKCWADLKYRTKEKALKNVNETTGTVTVLTELEKRILKIISNDQCQIGDSNNKIQIIADQDEYVGYNKTADPEFIEFLEHADSLSPESKPTISPSPSPSPSLSSSPSPSPLPPAVTELSNKRKRRDSGENNNESHKLRNTVCNNSNSNNNNADSIEKNKSIHHQQLIELRRLELEKLRESNFHEREKVRAEIEKEKHRDVIKIQQQFMSFLQDIKPALINFLNK